MKMVLPNFKRKSVVVAIIAFCSLLVAQAAYGWYTDNRILPNTFIGSVAVGGLTQDQATAKLQSAVDSLEQNGIKIKVEGETEIIQLDDIDFDINLSDAVGQAFARGHSGNYLARQAESLAALWSKESVAAPIKYDLGSLRLRIADLAAPKDIARKDIRLGVDGLSIKLLTDTAPGRVIDKNIAERLVASSIEQLSSRTIEVGLVDDPPRADINLAGSAVSAAAKMISRPLLLTYEDVQFSIGRERIAGWLTSDYDGSQLKPGLSDTAISQYVTNIAKTLNIAPEPPKITTDEGHVTGFTLPKVGRSVQEDQLIKLITAAIMDRAAKDKIGDNIVIPMKTTKMGLAGLDSATGISEVIGRAVTPFTGSPKNRISNIKNGVRFLSGAIIQPGEEFSTLKTLGVIDNTTGYLPELVIKGDRTVPDFGGGLCQVSTTLFRAVLDAGLPITARKNHSYRVSYYEKDGNGKFIGPGLDATIYQPDLDFKFRNDMPTPILIIGYVIGDKVTFELYGTRDGRTSKIDGPHLLTETAPGPAVYIETTELAPGVIKQVETPHPGGSAVATYTITYPDGRQSSQEFRSYYRRWPAKYLKGVAQLSTATPTPAQ